MNPISNNDLPEDKLYLIIGQNNNQLCQKLANRFDSIPKKIIITSLTRKNYYQSLYPDAIIHTDLTVNLCQCLVSEHEQNRQSEIIGLLSDIRVLLIVDNITQIEGHEFNSLITNYSYYRMTRIFCVDSLEITPIILRLYANYIFIPTVPNNQDTLDHYGIPMTCIEYAKECNVPIVIMDVLNIDGKYYYYDYDYD